MPLGANSETSPAVTHWLFFGCRVTDTLVSGFDGFMLNSCCCAMDMADSPTPVAVAGACCSAAVFGSAETDRSERYVLVFMGITIQTFETAMLASVVASVVGGSVVLL